MSRSAQFHGVPKTPFQVGMELKKVQKQGGDALVTLTSEYATPTSYIAIRSSDLCWTEWSSSTLS